MGVARNKTLCEGMAINNHLTGTRTGNLLNQPQAHMINKFNRVNRTIFLDSAR